MHVGAVIHSTLFTPYIVQQNLSNGKYNMKEKLTLRLQGPLEKKVCVIKPKHTITVTEVGISIPEVTM